MTDPSSNPRDLAELRERFPGWELEARWLTVGTGSDRRRLLACRGSVTVSAWTAEALAEAIRQEEQR